MDFSTILIADEEGFAQNLYQAKINDNWISAFISIEFSNANFGQYNNRNGYENATQCEGLKLLFNYLAEQGKIPA